MPFKLEYICGRNYNPLPEQEHIKYMRRCFELALKGHPKTYPNPLVGSVIVYDNQIIGEGYHTGFGKPHAEVEAIHSVADKSLLSQSTLYVNLEPCAHHGKTPPCADLIVKHGLSHVVISNLDPHDKVAGQGIARLQSAGIKVTVGVLEKEGAHLNRRFITNHEAKRPYVILKWAETADGFMGRDPSELNASNHISNSLADIYVHQLRAESGAIFVGTNTAILDNPSLTTRLVEGNDPLRVVLDIKGKIPLSHSLFRDGKPTLVLGVQRSAHNAEFVEVPNPDLIFELLVETLVERQIDQVLIEGGSNILQQCLAKGFWDEIHVISSKDKWDKGTMSPTVRDLDPQKVLQLKDNTVKIYVNNPVDS